MNNGMMFLILGLGLLWLMGGNRQAKWIGGSQAAQETAAYEIGF